MKTFPLIEKDIKASPFYSDDGLLLNKKRKKFQKNNIELSKKHGENSLDYLTKKVMKYIKQSKTNYINLKNIANDIKIEVFYNKNFFAKDFQLIISTDIFWPFKFR